eukprot:1992356-Prymnesium_polylepis.1
MYYTPRRDARHITSPRRCPVPTPAAPVRLPHPNTNQHPTHANTLLRDVARRQTSRPAQLQNSQKHTHQISQLWCVEATCEAAFPHAAVSMACSMTLIMPLLLVRPQHPQQCQSTGLVLLRQQRALGVRRLGGARSRAAAGDATCAKDPHAVAVCVCYGPTGRGTRTGH